MVGTREDEREENGNTVSRELLSASLVSRFNVVRRITPRVDVVSPEVDVESGVGAAVEVVGHVNTNGRVVGCSVTNTELSVTSILDVCLGVANSGLDESAGVGGVLGV